jgi:hypothetical protein
VFHSLIQIEYEKLESMCMIHCGEIDSLTKRGSYIRCGHVLCDKSSSCGELIMGRIIKSQLETNIVKTIYNIISTVFYLPC